MKRKQLFWGFFFLTLGTLALLNQYFSVYVDFDLLWDSWPLILIVLGIAVIFTGKVTRTIFGILLGILVGALVFGIFQDDFFFPTGKNAVFEDFGNSSPLVEKYNPNYEYAKLKLNAGAGKIIFGGETENLWECDFNGDEDLLDTYTDVENNSVTSEIEMTKNFWRFWRGENKLKIALNENPVWTLELNIGAASADVHLENYKVEKMELHSGASDTKIYLGSKFPLVKVEAQVGAANFTLFIPKNSGCKIEVQSVLVNKKFSNFIYKGDGTFVSHNFDNSVNKVLVSFEGGLANFKVKYY